MKSIQIALLLALLLPVAAEVSADSRPSKSSSFKSGFSSQRSAPTSTNRAPSSRNSSFGGFGKPSAPPPRAPDPAPAGRSGGFGSFGGTAPRQDNSAMPAPQKSESALSQRLNKSNSEANALRTLEARRSAEQAANAPRDIRPVPSGPLPSNGQYNSGNNGQYNNGGNGQYSSNNGRYNNGNNGQYDNRSPGQSGSMPMPIPMPSPVVVQQGSNGLMNMITGFLLAKATTSSHASNNYPSTAASNGNVHSGAVASTASAPKEGGFFTSLLRTIAWLTILAIVGWLAYFAWKFLRRGKAPSRANYSFERD